MIDIRTYEQADLAAVRALFVRVNRELAPSHLKAAFEDYIVRSLAEEVERIPQYYTEHRGSFWVATDEASLLGMFGLEEVDPATTELRRMYVDPDARRRGIARHMLAFAEETARRGGYAVMTLSTSELQAAALALYRAAGYRLLREDAATAPSNKTVGAGILRYYFTKNL